MSEVIPSTRPSRLLLALGAFGVVFGLLTLRAGSNMLFGDRSLHGGPVVPFVLWFNFLAGFVYVAAGVGLLLRRRWGGKVAAALALSTLFVAIAFAVHVLLGGASATRTIGALALRTGFWTFAAYRAHVGLGGGAGRVGRTP